MAPPDQIHLHKPGSGEEKQLREGREAEQAITEVFAVWDMLEIQYDSHQSEIFLDATEKDRLHKEEFNF